MNFLDTNTFNWEYMDASKKIWTLGNSRIPDGFREGCAVAVSDDEIWLIGGKGKKQKHRILPFFTKNHTFAKNSQYYVNVLQLYESVKNFMIRNIS